MAKKTKTHFKQLNSYTFAELRENPKLKIGVSDLCLQDEVGILQYELIEEEQKRTRKKIKIYPGIYNLLPTQAGIVPDEFELRESNILETFCNTDEITGEFKEFFSKLDIYEELNIAKKRALLLYGPPGTGKTTSIIRSCNKLSEEDSGTVVFNWNTSDARSSDVLDFFTSAIEYTKECTKVIVIIEDIGTTSDNNYGNREVDRAMLNYLDGVGVSFPLPTFVVATTNHIANLPENLVNRPGRFDNWIQVDPPSVEERLALTEFIADRKLTEDEKDALSHKDCNVFSAAHIKEIIVRTKLKDCSIADVIKHLKDHSTRFNKAFAEAKGGGMGLF